MKAVLAAIVILGSGLSSFAQTEDLTTIRSQAPTKEISSQGFRVSLLRPNWDAEVTLKFRGEKSTSPKQNFSDIVGIGLGYAELPVEQIGFTGNFSFIELKENKATMQFLRADGNLGYAFTKYVNVKGGLNMSHMSKVEPSSDIKWTPAIGAQAGLGIQVTENFGIDLSYTYMNQKGEVDLGSSGKGEVETKEQGVEVALHATF